MKKLTSLLIILFMTAAMIQQANAQSPVSFGLKGGLNISNLHGSDLEPDAKTGVLLGAVLEINVPVLPFGVESGVYYSQKGAETDVAKIKLDYLEVPLLAKFQLGPPGPITPSLAVGPYIGFNLNEEGVIAAKSIIGNVEFDDVAKSTEIGGIASLGLDFNLGLTKLNASARYSYGFTSVFEDDFNDGENNAVFSIALGIMF